MRSLIRRLGRHTIWDPKAIPASEWTYRNMKRVWFPLYDGLMVASGVLGVIHGTPVIREVFDPRIAVLGAYALIVVGLVCAAGVAIPRLYLLEVYGKSALLALLVGYAAALIALSVLGDPNRALIAGIALAACIPPCIRLDILKNERRKRDAVAQIARIEGRA